MKVIIPKGDYQPWKSDRCSAWRSNSGEARRSLRKIFAGACSRWGLSRQSSSSQFSLYVVQKSGGLKTVAYSSCCSTPSLRVFRENAGDEGNTLNVPNFWKSLRSLRLFTRCSVGLLADERHRHVTIGEWSRPRAEYYVIFSFLPPLQRRCDNVGWQGQCITYGMLLMLLFVTLY